MTDTSLQMLRKLLEDHELWGVAEVCEELGTTSGNLDRWARLPQPAARIRASRVWIADDIRDYLEARRTSEEADVEYPVAEIK